MERSRPATDTIAAVATAAGVAGISVVRLSGPGAGDILRALVPERGELPEARKATLAWLEDPHDGTRLDRALVTFFPGPDSFTGEDVVELSCHGGWTVPALVLEACLAAGARRAEPGEFSRRAYLNGKMDLVQVEAVADLVEGRSRALHGAAVHQLERGLSRRIAELRQGLIHLEALLVHHVDFPDEDDAPVPADEVAEHADGLVEGMEALLATAPEGELLREGALAVLAGRPNAGKSSLFNALVGRERAIVTEVPGTTRDAVDALISVEGFPFRLVDTAGLRRTEEEVEGKGIEVARRYVEKADVLLFCVEAGRPLGSDETAFLESVTAPVILVRTMADLAPGPEGSPPERASPDGEGEVNEEWDDGEAGKVGGSEPAAGAIRASVITGEGLERIREALTRLVYAGIASGGADAPVLTRRRQARSVRTARDEVAAFARGLRGGVPAEVAATHLRTAETALEEILGVVSRDEVLDHLFAAFCIGK